MSSLTSRVWALAETALELLVANWPTDGSAAALPERRYVNFGAVIWDCEQVVVSVERTFGIGGDVTQEQFQADYGVMALRAVTLAVWVIRCVPDIDSSGTQIILPTGAEIQAAHEVLSADADQLLAIFTKQQRLHNFAGCESLAFENMQAMGPEGGFGGSVTRLRAGLI